MSLERVEDRGQGRAVGGQRQGVVARGALAKSQSAAGKPLGVAVVAPGVLQPSEVVVEAGEARVVRPEVPLGDRERASVVPPGLVEAAQAFGDDSGLVQQLDERRLIRALPGGVRERQRPQEQAPGGTVAARRT